MTNQQTELRTLVGIKPLIQTTLFGDRPEGWFELFREERDRDLMDVFSYGRKSKRKSKKKKKKKTKKQKTKDMIDSLPPAIRRLAGF